MVKRSVCPGRKRGVIGYDCTPVYNDCITGSADTYECCVHDVFAAGWDGTSLVSPYCQNQNNANIGNCDSAKTTLANSASCSPCTDLACCELAYSNASGHSKAQGIAYNSSCQRATPGQVLQYENAPKTGGCGGSRC